jgi:hypothetical protein
MAAKGDILVVDDLLNQGNIVRGHIKDRRGFGGVLPESVKELIQSVLFKVYEGAMIDIVWEEWERPFRVKGLKKAIHDGIEFARFIFGLNPKLAESIALYSSVARLGEPELMRRIDSLPFQPKVISTPFHWNRKEAQKELKPIFDEVARVRKANPLRQPPNFIDRPLNEKLLAYKSINAEYARWADCHFDNIGDYSWAVVCGTNVETELYGAPLSNEKNNYGIDASEQYPKGEALERLSKKRDNFPFIFWNARKPEFIKSQFELAGPGLTKIPRMWRSFFGIAMAPPCSRAYLGGDEVKVLEYCRELDDTGKVEVTKQIYKLLRKESPAGIERFAQMAAARELPVIADSLMGEVASIDRVNSSAKVIIRTFEGQAFVEVMRLERLEEAGVRFVGKEFEYTVYQQHRGQVSATIEPCDDDESLSQTSEGSL